MNRSCWLLISVCALLAAAHAGTFRNPRLIPTAFDPAGVAAGDFNRDGRLDIIYVDGRGPYALHVLLGKGNGDFTHSQDMALPSGICGYLNCYLNLADVNDDGLRDVIIGGGGSSTAHVAVALGNVDGTFQTAITSNIADSYGNWPLLNSPLGIGDLNGDGAADLVAADPMNGKLWVAYGDNSGHFTYAYATFAGYANAAYVLDLNGDGRLDVLCTDNLGAGATVFLGNGDGTLRQGVRYSTGAASPSFLLADVDGDGHVDLVAQLYPDQIMLMKGNADGTFASAVTVMSGVPDAQLVGAGDFNGDGVPDIAVLDKIGVGVLLGHGSPVAFQPPVSTLAASSDRSRFATGDFDGDGHLDIALGVKGGILLLTGKGDGTFASVDYYDLGHAVGGVAAADFTSDGVTDIAVMLPSGIPRLLVGTGNGNFSVGSDPNGGSTTTDPSCRLTAGDFNGDGKKDLARTGVTFPWGDASALFGHGDGTFSAPIAVATGQTAVADLNHDGRIDILAVTDVAGNTSPGITAYLAQKDGSFTAVSTDLRNSLVSSLSAVGDLNNDGYPDILIRTVQATIEVWLGRGDGTFRFQSTIPDAVVLGIADLDGDGYGDVILTSYENVYDPRPPSLTILPGNGDGTFKSPVYVSLERSYSQLTVADVNQDNKPDLVLNDAAGIAVIINQGQFNFGPEAHYVAGAGDISGMIVVDVNGDGFPDIVAPSGGGHTVTVLLNDPNGTPPGGDGIKATLAVTPEPSDYDQPFTATFIAAAPTPSSPAPQGTVTFSLDGRMVATVALAGGQAAYTFTSELTPGAHSVVATYNGDDVYRAVSSAAQHMVNPPNYVTQTTLTAMPASLLTSQTVRLIARVTSAGANVQGVVTFYDGSNVLRSQTVGSGTAQFDTALLSQGKHMLSAKYQGITFWEYSSIWAIYQPSTSAPVVVTVQATPTATTLSPSSTSAVLGTVLTFTAAVSSSPTVPFGGVTFYDGSVAIGTMSLTDGRTAFSIASLGVGTHSITAKFNANATYAASNSAAVGISITGASGAMAPTFTSMREVSVGDQLSLTATVASPAGTPAGTVMFLDQGAIVATAELDGSGSAAIPVGILGTGSHSIRASFSGNAAFAPSVSPELSTAWPGVDPKFLLSVTSLSSGTVRVTIKPTAADFHDPVILSCGDGLPKGYGCSFSPNTLTGGGSSYLVIVPSRAVNTASGRARYGLWLALVTGAMVGGWRRRRTALLMLVLAGAAFIVISGCGTRQPAAGGQTAVVTIRATSGTGAGTVAHAAQVVVTIAP